MQAKKSTCVLIISVPETNSSPLKMDGWVGRLLSFLLGRTAYVQGGSVSFREGNLSLPFPNSVDPSPPRGNSSARREKLSATRWSRRVSWKSHGRKEPIQILILKQTNTQDM